MQLGKSLLGTVWVLMLASCVTINIYFPAAAAEKAADRIIEDVWGPETDKPAAKPESESKRIPSSQWDSPNSLALIVLDWFIPAAQAAEANLNINSPAINAIQAKMKERHSTLKEYYQNGAVGLTADGLVTIRDAKAIPLKDRNEVKGLVANENADRQALYAEIARANGHPEWQADIQSTFARRWVDNASQGWWYQQGSDWKQK